MARTRYNPSTPPEASPACKRCGKPIARGEARLALGNGWYMHLPCHAEHAQQVRAMTERAIAEGRHSPIEQWRTTCQGCGGQVPFIWHQTLDKKRFCVACAAKSGLPSALAYLERQAADARTPEADRAG